MAEPLVVGILYHKCLEVYYGALYNDIDKYDAQGLAFDVIDPFTKEAGYEDTYETVERMLAGYFEYYTNDKWDIVAVEETLIYQDDFDYSARLDLILHDKKDSGIWLGEHKSARMISAELMESYQLDLQILGQVWLFKNCVDLSQYPPFRGVRVNIITKHETPQFTRVDVCPSQAHLDAFEDSIRAWNQLKVEYARRGWPQSLGHCSGYARGYGQCPNYSLCHGYPSVSVAEWRDTPDDKLPEGYRRRTV
jgi:hypothetical protein